MHSHANDVFYTVDYRHYPHLAPTPHPEFYDRPLDISRQFFEYLARKNLAWRTLDRPGTSYEEITGRRVSITEDGTIRMATIGHSEDKPDTT